MFFRKNGLKKIIVTFVCSLLLTSIVGVSAANMSPRLNISTDKDEYTSNEEISVEVFLHNGTDIDITDIDIMSEIPKGLEVTNGNVHYNTDIVKVGESVSYRYTLNSVSSENGDEENSGFEENGDTNVKDENLNNQNKDSYTNKKITDEKSKSIKTGDEDFNYLIIIFLLSFVIILCLFNKKIRKRFFVFVIVGALISTNLLNVTAVNDPLAENSSLKLSSEKTIKVGDKEYLLKANADYETIDDEYMTRGEWINTLVEKMKYPSIDFSFEKPYFDDTSGTSVEEAINYAVAYKIVDLNSDKFYPTEYATREFIATTTINALGFVTDKEIECTDSLNIGNKQTAYLAVDLNIIDLIDGYFYPNEYADSNTIDQAITVIDEVLGSTNVCETPVIESKFKDNVIEIDSEQITVSNGVITSDNNVLRDIEIGDIVALSETEAYKVTGKNMQENQTILSITFPEIEEVYNELHMEGSATADFDDFIPAEGVNVSISQTETKTRTSVVIPEYEETMDFTVDLTELIKIKGKIGANLAATYDFTIGKSDKFLILYNKLDTEVGIYIGDEEVTEKEEIKKLLDYLTDDNKSEGTIPLGSIPIGTTPVVVDFALAYTAEGYLKIVNNYNGKIGGQIYNGNARFISDINSEQTMEFGGKLSLGLEMIGAIKFLDKYILDVSAGLGITGEGTINLRSNGMLCNDLNAFVYLNMKLMDHTDWDDVLFNFELEKEFWHSKNSPFKLNIHWENGKLVKECTFVPFFSGGDGSEENPYQVSTPEQLNAVRNNLEAHYIQINDIDLSYFDNWDPIGYIDQLTPDNTTNLFSGSFDGNNYIITGLTIDEPTTYATLGLFGYSNGKIKNVNLKNILIDIDKSNINYPYESKYKVYVGAICAHNYSSGNYDSHGKIVNCTVNGTIIVRNIADCNVGGITGAFGEINNCINYASINILANKTSNDRYPNDNTVNCGGISGGDFSTISKCINYGNIDAHAGNYIKCGGISGDYSNYIGYCINYGDISGQTDSYYTYSMYGPANCVVGGIVGYQSNGNTMHVINYGNVFGLASNTAYCQVGGISGSRGTTTYSEFLTNVYNYGRNIESVVYKLENGELIKIHGAAGRIYAGTGQYSGIFNLNSVNYTIINGEILIDDGSFNFGENGLHGLSLTEEEMNKKIQYILDELDI